MGCSTLHAPLTHRSFVAVMCITAILGELFPEDVPAAFANFKLWQSLLMGTAFLLGSALSSAPKLYLWLLLGFLVVSTACVQSALAIDRREKAKQAA